MAVTGFKINGVTIKAPDSFKIERYNITNSNRLGNGDMSMELIAKKLKFYLTWEALDGSKLDAILKLIWETSAMFFDFTYLENGVSKTCRCYAGSIPTDLHRAKGNHWVWKDVSIDFIQK